MSHISAASSRHHLPTQIQTVSFPSDHILLTSSNSWTEPFQNLLPEIPNGLPSSLFHPTYFFPITILPKQYYNTLPAVAPTSTNKMSTAKPKNFELRGDLRILVTGTQSDCDLIVGNHKFQVHKAILESRGGCLKTLLSGDGKDEQVSFCPA